MTAITLSATLALVFAVGATAALVVYGLLAWERIVRRQRELQAGAAWTDVAGRVAAADQPRPFAAPCAWLAVRADDAEAVVRALRLRTVLPANWATGLAEAQQCGVFVTPPVDGWVLAVGADLRAEGGDIGAFVTPLLERLGARFGAAAWFLTDVAEERHGWALAHRHGLRRGYAYHGEHGHVFWHGEVTEAEHGLGCYIDDPRDTSDDECKWWPDTREVFALAAIWSVDPRRLPERAPQPSVGSIGRL